MSLLEHERVLITGGAGSIGIAVVKGLAQEGAELAILDRDEKAAVKLAKEIKATFGVKAKGYYFDVADLSSHHEITEEVEREFGTITILINCAGITSTTNYEEMTPDEYDHLMDINLRGPFFFTREIFLRMKARGKGRIINFGSISGERGGKYSGPHYSLSKAGMICFTKMLAKWAEDTGVTVNTVSPGLIQSRMSEQVGNKVYNYDVPMNRMGTPEEVAGAVLFLSSRLSDYVTGQNISVNGGQSMR